MERKDDLMEYRTLGASGLKVSRLSLGSALVWGKEDQSTCDDVVKLAWESGINFFDTSEAYGDGISEQLLGNSLRKLGAPRSDYVVATKIFWGKQAENKNSINNRGTSRKRLYEGLERSLKYLGFDYVDLVLCHRYDYNTPTIEVVQAFKSLIDSGKVLYWGTSTWPVERVMEAILLADKIGCPRPIAEQCEYSMLTREPVEKNYVALFDDYKYGTTVWSPLCSGLLTGKYNEGIPDGSRFDKFKNVMGKLYSTHLGTDELRIKTVEKFNKLQKIAESLGTNQTRLAIAWTLKCQDVTTTILGARDTDQLTDNLQALEVVAKITKEISEEIEAVLGNRPTQEMNYATYKPLKDRR